MKKKTKYLFKNKQGMTLVELLVAMTLFMVIAMAFTPMLISSYNNIYKAGEKHEEVYAAQTGVERELSRRTQYDVISSFGDFKLLNKNGGKIANAIDVSLRKATYGLTSKIGNSIQSLFYKGKGRIEIISAKRVNDDTVDKTVVVRASGFKIDKVLSAGDDYSHKTDPKKESDGNGDYDYTVVIGAYVPQRTVSTGEDLYKNSANLLKSDGAITYTKNSEGETIITLNLKGVDMSCSPVQIVVRYYDENSKVSGDKVVSKPKEVASYLYIDSPTLIIGSKTSSETSYYTCTGIKETKTSSNNIERSMDIDARLIGGNISDTYHDSIAAKMPQQGSTEIRNVSWITNDDVTGYNYYVLTGTNGTILRMYAPQNDSQYTAAQAILDAETSANVGTSGRKNLLKAVPVSENGGKRTSYPIFWSGDYSHQFGFSTFQKSMGYGGSSLENKNKSCWYTQDGTSGRGQAPVFSTQARYAYMFNGENTKYNYVQQQSRRISYTLTEKDYALRAAYDMAGLSGDFTGYNDLWEEGTEALWSTIFSGGSSTESNVFKITQDAKDSNKIWEKEFSQIRIKGLNTLSDSSLLMNYEAVRGKGSYSGNNVSLPGTTPPNYLGDNYTANRTNLNVTSAVYDPGLGKMFYTGIVSSYAFVLQTDNMNTGKNDTKEMEWKGGPDGSFTGYFIRTNSDWKTSTIVKSCAGTEAADYNAVVTDLKSKTGESTNSTGNRTSFYMSRTNTNLKLDDVLFTLGYTSNREFVYSNITYDGSTEAYKSYEKYYFLSHYGLATHVGTFYSGGNNNKNNNNCNSAYINHVNNDYYNVWFPGECYNLISTANKEGVTVSVGYAVSGSSFQWINPNDSNKRNYSTALGGVFNDGVLAAKFEESGSFTNLLYYKDAAQFDSNSLSAGNYSYYSSVYGTYGTHSRQSIRFTSVDLLVFNNVSGTNTKEYVAYYGDSTGRAFYSKVASVTVASQTTSDPHTLVNYISDLSAAQTVKDQAGGQMTEIKLPDGNNLSSVFKSITNITATNGYIIISGISKDSNCYVVVGTATQTNDAGAVTYTWKKVIISSGTSYTVNDTCIVDNVFYAVGKTSGTQGFILGVEVALFEDVANGGSLSGRTVVKTTTKKGQKNLTELYSIAGKGGNIA